MNEPRARDSVSREGLILDLFAGPGGWSEGLRMLGLSDVGIEWDDAACRTRAAAGHSTIRADVAQYPTAPFVGKVTGIIASPPCQDFSMAGKRAGRTGEKGQLIDDVPRWVDDIRPEWVALEQVPPALEVWEEFARLFRSWGYSAWCGVLNAADFGVPQTRRRAILVASQAGAALPPEPTHAKNPEPGLFGDLAPWVSMAEALGWDDCYLNPGRTDSQPNRRLYSTDEPAPTVAFGHDATSWGCWIRRERSGDRSEEGFDPHEIPAQTLTSKARSWRAEWFRRQQAEGRWVVDTRRDQREDGSTQTFDPAEVPAKTFTGKSGEQWQVWPYERPATVVCADPRLSPPGYRGRPDGYDEDGAYLGKRSTDNAIKLTVAEALTLQSFRPDYPVQGSRTKQFEQVGNAVPPVLAAAVISQITSCRAREVAAVKRPVVPERS